MFYWWVERREQIIFPPDGADEIKMPTPIEQAL